VELDLALLNVLQGNRCLLRELASKLQTKIFSTKQVCYPLIANLRYFKSDIYAFLKTIGANFRFEVLEMLLTYLFHAAESFLGS